MSEQTSQTKFSRRPSTRVAGAVIGTLLTATACAKGADPMLGKPLPEGISCSTHVSYAGAEGEPVDTTKPITKFGVAIAAEVAFDKATVRTDWRIEPMDKLPISESVDGGFELNASELAGPAVGVTGDLSSAQVLTQNGTVGGTIKFVTGEYVGEQLACTAVPYGPVV